MASCRPSARVEGGDVEASACAEHREGLELAVGLVTERLVRAPVPARGQQRLAGLEEVGDGEAQGAGPARGRDRDSALLEVGLAAEQVLDDRAQERRRPGDRRVRRPLDGRYVVHDLRGGRQDGELAVIVEEHADRRVDDDLAARLALRRFAVEREDRVVAGAALVGGDEVIHGRAF